MDELLADLEFCNQQLKDAGDDSAKQDAWIQEKERVMSKLSEYIPL